MARGTQSRAMHTTPGVPLLVEVNVKSLGLDHSNKTPLVLLQEIDGERETEGNRVFYLSSSPSLFPTIVEQLGEAGMNEAEDGGYSRLVIEKPFGHDLESAQ